MADNGVETLRIATRIERHQGNVAEALISGCLSRDTGSLFEGKH
jgi:hypothetical protein